MERKVIELKIKPEDNIDVNFISLVEEPAVMVDFLAFSKTESFKFNIDEDKRELLGVAMIPDKKIPRLDKDNNVYDVFFSRDTIRQIAQNFMLQGYQANINVDHSDEMAKSYVYQSYLVDKANGLDSPFDVPDGSWIVGVKVLDDTTWNKVKSGDWKGFSVEGIFQKIEKFNQINESDNLTEVLAILKNVNRIITQNG